MESEVKNERLVFWKEQIQKWQESNLSQPEYCETHKIKLSTFVYYRHRLLNLNRQHTQAINFVAVKASSSQPHPTVPTLHLILPNGIRVGISSEISETVLKMVLNVAGQVKC
jgi:hypothetical protein